MGLPSFARDKITVVSPGTKKVYGSDVVDWSPDKISTREIFPCVADQATAEELADRDRTTTMDAWNLLIDVKDVPPAAIDKVILPNGKEYQVEGEARVERSPSGNLDVQRLWLERWVNHG